jgi:hypothetical protein
MTQFREFLKRLYETAAKEQRKSFERERPKDGTVPIDKTAASDKKPMWQRRNPRGDK